MVQKEETHSTTDYEVCRREMHVTCEVIPRLVQSTGYVFRHVTKYTRQEQEQALEDKQVHLRICQSTEDCTAVIS